MHVSLEQWLSFLTLAAIILAVLLAYLQRAHNLLAWLLLGYFLAGVSFIALRWHLQIDLGMPDAKTYQALSAQTGALLRADFWGNLPYAVKSYAAYTFPVGLLYFVLGLSEPLGQLFNTAVALAVMVNLHRLAGGWFSPRVADRTVIFMALSPYLLILSTTMNRDMLVVLCIIGFFRLLSHLRPGPQEAPRPWRYAALAAVLIYMTLLRPPLVILAGLALFVYIFSAPHLSRRYSFIRRALRFSFILLVLGVGTLTFLAVGKFYTARYQLEQQATHFSDVDHMNQRLQHSENASSAYLKGVRYSSYHDVAQVMPLAAGYFLFSPLPWQVSSPKHFLGLLDVVWVVVVTWFCVRGIPRLYRRDRKLSLAVVAFLALGVAASGVLQANAGSAMRHRTMFTLLMLPVAVAAMTSRERRRACQAGGKSGSSWTGFTLRAPAPPAAGASPP